MKQTLEKLSQSELIGMILEQNQQLEQANQQLEKANQQLEKANALIANITNENRDLTSRVDDLKHQISWLKTQMFGDKKEKIIGSSADGKQGKLFEDENQNTSENANDANNTNDTIQVSYSRKKTPKKRTDFSKLEFLENLESEEVVIEPSNVPEGSIFINFEITELLVLKKAKLYKKVIKRAKYANPGKQGVIIAELPARVIPGGSVDESVLAMIIVDKFLYHLPLDRLRKKFLNLGVKIPESTLSNWVQKTSELLAYLFNELKKIVRHVTYIQMDETTIRVLDRLNKPGTTHRGYYWVMRCVEYNAVIITYHEGRGKNCAEELLHDFNGYLQTDGYAAYENIDQERDGIEHLCCFAHARRKFFDAQSNNHALASAMLKQIQVLYEIEEQARTMQLSHEDRKLLRQEKAVPVLQQIKTWMEENRSKTTPQSPIGKAIDYTLKRWQKLIQYANNGLLEIDNNQVENVMRPIALGRKNYLFAGSHEAAANHAMIYSFSATCHANGINFDTWLHETLLKLPTTKTSQLHTLLPLKRIFVPELVTPQNSTLADNGTSAIQ